MGSDGFLEIGPFSRRVGVSVDLLRAWERRYGLPRPERTANGRRLYTRADELAVRAMRRGVERGLPAAEAARLAAADEADPTASEASDGELETIAAGLRDAVTALDEARAQEQLDRLFGGYSLDTALAQVIVPYVHELGERWAAAEIGVADEHFATNLIQGRLLSLSRKWGEGRGPRALLACPTGELHTIGLLAFGLALRMHGWRITYLGADTPLAAVAAVAARMEPARVVLASVNSDVYRRADAGIRGLAAGAHVAIAGAGASKRLADDLGVELLELDPVGQAAAIA